MTNSTIGRYTQIRLLCDVCHGSGLTSDFRGKDIGCFGCGGVGALRLAIHDLDRQDLEQLALVAAAEACEVAVSS